MTTTITVANLREKYQLLSATMNERARRHWAAAEALSLPHGGISLVSKATGLSRTTITAGIDELRRPATEQPSDAQRSRRRGGGRHTLQVHDVTLIADLERLIDPATRGDPMSPLLWTCKSTRQLAGALQQQGHKVSHSTVGTLLHNLGYSLQVNRKTREGSSHPDRNAQFEFISGRVRAFQKGGQPVISVDTKKKENIGNFRNNGVEWRPKGNPEEVLAKDFPDKSLGKAIPYGVYDLTHNRGWVSVGIDHDTARFAVESIRRWWLAMGKRSYPAAKQLLITADGGGSNGHRNRLWKVELQGLANETRLEMSVCHFPPGTSKWNKIEHGMFCQITENWRSRPLTSRAVVVNLIGSTTTVTGLSIHAEIDQGQYPLGEQVADEELASVSIRRSKFHGEWNYTVAPQPLP